MEWPEHDVGTEVNSLVTLFFVNKKHYYDEIFRHKEPEILDCAIQTCAGVVTVLAMLKKVKPITMWQAILIQYAMLSVTDEKLCE